MDTLRVAVASPPPLAVTPSEVMARPRYQLRVDSPYGSAIMVLGRAEGHQEYWVTSTKQVLVLENGLIRRATGFPENLEGTRLVADDGATTDPFAIGLHRLPASARSTREVDWMPGYRYGVRIQSRFERVGVEEREILGVKHRLLRIDEHLQSEAAGFSGTNRYWVDPQDGFIFISEQQPLPGLALRLTQLRPYREASR